MVWKHLWFVERENMRTKGVVMVRVCLCSTMKKWPISVFLFLLHSTPPSLSLSLSRVQKFLPGNSDLEHQKEMTAEYENFYINSTLNTHVGLHCRLTMHTHTHTQTQTYCTHTCFHAVNTVVAVCYEGFSSITSTVRSLSECVNPSVRLVRVDTFPAHTSWWAGKV